MMSESIYQMDDYILDPFQQKKKRRMEAVMGMLKRLKEVDLKEFTAKVAVNCGIHESTTRRYIEALKTSGYIEIKDGMIIWKKQD